MEDVEEDCAAKVPSHTEYVSTVIYALDIAVA